MLSDYSYIYCIFPYETWPGSTLQLDMEDGDEIDAMLHQTGGASSWYEYAVSGSVVLNILYTEQASLFC